MGRVFAVIWASATVVVNVAALAAILGGLGIADAHWNPPFDIIGRYYDEAVRFSFSAIAGPVESRIDWRFPWWSGHAAAIYAATASAILALGGGVARRQSVIEVAKSGGLSLAWPIAVAAFLWQAVRLRIVTRFAREHALALVGYFAMVGGAYAGARYLNEALVDAARGETHSAHFEVETFDWRAAALANIEAAGLDAATASAWRRYAAAYDAVRPAPAGGLPHTAQEGEGRYFDKTARIEKSPLLIEVQAQGDDPKAAEWARLNAEVGRLYNAGDYAGATAKAEEALRLAEAAFGKEDPLTLTSVNNLAGLLEAKGDYAAAEPLYRRALEARERVLGKEHPDTLQSVNNLALLYASQGRYAEAEPLYKRALEARERVLGKEHPDTLQSVNNLAGLYRDQGRYAEAEPLFKRAFEARERVLGKEHPDTLASVNNLAGLYASQGRYAEAEPLFKHALEASERVLGKEHPRTLISVNNLAFLYQVQGRYGEAEPLYRRALEASERVLEKEHPSTLLSLQNYFFWRAAAGAAGLKSQWSGDAGAVRLLRELLAGFDGYVAGGIDPARLADPTSLESRAAQLVSSFERARLAGVDGSDAPGLREPVFSIIQRLNASAAAKALAASAERLVVTDAAQRELEEEKALSKTSLKSELATLDALRLLPQRNAEAESAAHARIASLQNRITQIESALVEGNAADAELLGAARATTGDLTAVAKDRAQALLDDDEAMLVYSSVGGGYFAFVTTRRLSTAVSLDVSREAIDRRVTALRKGLALPASGNARDLATFDLDAAEALHKILIDPLKPHLRGVSKLIIVADGPLQSLPFGVLVEGAGDASQKGFERYQTARFLIDRYAVSVQPSVSAISTLRAETPRSAGSKPLLGFADPVLRPGAADADDSIRVGKADEKKDLIIPMSGTVDARSLEDLIPLKQTKELLETVGASLGANARDLYIGEDAQEADIRFLNEQGRLKNYRMIVFATHGLVSNEIEAIDLIEPALVMSLPPVAAGKERPWENDGLLRASDIVGFDMDADLVILAACNTAAADGTPGAEPLSGLAKAFMARGARALLVSHWQAEAYSSAVLIPAMARYADKDGFSVGLAKAQREMRQNAVFDPDPANNTLHHTHPAIWGAFTLIGDPGR